MLISNETPPLSWALSGISGSTWDTGASFSRLTKGKPRIGCQVFRTSGASGFELEAQWTTASKPQVFAMLGLGEEWSGQSFGLSVANNADGGSEISLGTVTVERLADGSLGAIVFLPTLANNVDSVKITAGLLTGSAYYIGQVVIATAQFWDIRRDWVESVSILTKQNVTLTGQPFNVRRNQQRKAAVTIAPQTWERSVSIASVETLQKLQAGLSSQRPVLIIPALRAPGLGREAAIDMDSVYASALFGWCSDVGQIQLVDGSNLAQLRLQFTEAPAGRIN